MKDGMSTLKVIHLESPSQGAAGGNMMGKIYHKGGITQTGGQTMELEEATLNKEQENQNTSNKKSNEVQQAGK